MTRSHALFTGLAVPLVALALALTGCVDEKIVYRDRELFATPPTGAAGFLGYSKAEEKLTVCGNCHIGQQTKWQETAHAGAWVSLAESGHSQAFCEGCHTVGQLGNALATAGGWDATKDDRYKDVQCESCHGPGLTHVQNPSKATIGGVLAPVGVGAQMDGGCLECHTGTHHPFAEEWSASAHGTMSHSASAATRAACRDCHTGEDALKSWGINANYAEKATMLGDSLRNMPITCAVCHDPHATQGAGQLRFPVDVPNEESNLCMKCHHKRGQPDLTAQQRGPHSPEGPVLLGYGGWWPPNLDMPGGQIVATHGSERNPKLCAGCHLNKFTVNDPATGNFAFQATGHTFEAIPCLDATGKPVVNGNCAATERTYRTCTGAGCHGSEAVARSAMLTTELRMQSLTDELDRLLRLVQPNWRTCRGSNTCGANSEFNANDGRYTTAEGAAFNFDLGMRKSAAIHNPFLVEALLTATIRQVKTDYNITSPTLVDLELQLKGHR
jgi:predicted CXXCH cytochrome family protein